MKGKRFGGLKVIGPARPNRSGMPRWRCICGCGRHKTVNEAALLNGFAKNCGCGRRVWYRPTKPISDKRSAVLRDHGDWLEIDASTPKFPDAVMAIDAQDWKALNDVGVFRVYAHANKGHGSVRAVAVYGQARPLVHRLLLRERKRVYHKDRDGLNNRRDNLTTQTTKEEDDAQHE